jgi:hypothetical protein
MDFSEQLGWVEKLNVSFSLRQAESYFPYEVSNAQIEKPELPTKKILYMLVIR